MRTCERCRGKSAVIMSVALVNVDDESLGEGEHADGIDLALCEQCTAALGDALYEFCLRFVADRLHGRERKVQKPDYPLEQFRP